MMEEFKLIEYNFLVEDFILCQNDDVGVIKNKPFGKEISIKSGDNNIVVNHNKCDEKFILYVNGEFISYYNNLYRACYDGYLHSQNNEKLTNKYALCFKKSNGRYDVQNIYNKMYSTQLIYEHVIDEYFLDLEGCLIDVSITDFYEFESEEWFMESVSTATMYGINKTPELGLFELNFNEKKELIEKEVKLRTRLQIHMKKNADDVNIKCKSTK